MSHPARRARIFALVAAGALVLTACGDDDDATTAATTDAPAPTSEAVETTAAPTTAASAGGYDRAYGEAPATTAAAAPPASTAASEPMVSLAETSLGEVIVAADGLTLYHFEPDSPGTATCTEGCAANWPPYYVEDGTELTAGEGLDASLLSVVPHPEGGNMLQYGDWPLYYFAADQAPGDVNGQGVNDVWWAVDANGDPVMPNA